MAADTSMKHALHYAMYYAVIAFAGFVLLSFLFQNPLGNSGLLISWVIILFICLAQKSYRDNVLGGSITYGQAFKVGMATVFFSAFLYNVLIFFYLKMLRPELVENFRNYTMTEMEKMKDLNIMSDKLMDSMISQSEYLSAYSITQGDMFNKILGGFVIVLITSAIYKKDNSIFTPKE